MKEFSSLYTVMALILTSFFILSGCKCIEPEHDTLPEPSGSYDVGYISIDFEDSSRLEDLTDTPDDFRRINVRFWYPAEADPNLKTKKYASPEEAPILQEEHEKSNLFQSLGPASSLLQPYVSAISKRYCVYRKMDTNTFPEAAISDTERVYPVLLYSSGYWTFQFHNTALMEELASHGYIVGAISHPYEDVAAFFENGDIARRKSDMTVKFSKAYLLYERKYELSVLDGKPKSERRKLLLKTTENNVWVERLDCWEKDITFVLDQLSGSGTGKIPTWLQDKFDLSSIGALGFSFGAAASAQAAFGDQRIKAVVNIDSMQGGDGRLIDTDIGVPMLILYTCDNYNFENHTDVNEFFYGSSPDIHRFAVNSTLHGNLSDYSILFENNPYLKGFLGEISGLRASKILNTYVLAFFDKYLQGEENNILYGNSPDFPEVFFHPNP